MLLGAAQPPACCFCSENGGPPRSGQQKPQSRMISAESNQKVIEAPQTGHKSPLSVISGAWKTKVRTPTRVVPWTPTRHERLLGPLLQLPGELPSVAQCQLLFSRGAVRVLQRLQSRAHLNGLMFAPLSL